MESRFGQDFTDVRVHTDPDKANSAAAKNALAYTMGSDIVFGPGLYDPHTPLGKQLLAHELVHVVQQRSGTNTSPGSSHEQEAENISHTVSSSPHVSVRARSRAGISQPAPASTPSVQAKRRILIDASVFGEINRGNADAARVLKERLADSECFIAQEAYNAMVTDHPSPAMRDANRKVLSDLSVTVGPPKSTQGGKSFEKRVAVYHKNITAKKSGGPIVQQEPTSPNRAVGGDIYIVAQAAAAGPDVEVWGLDRVFRRNPKSIEAPFGVKVAPESSPQVVPQIVGNKAPENPQTARALLGLDKHGGPAGGGGGAGPAGEEALHRPAKSTDERQRPPAKTETPSEGPHPPAKRETSPKAKAPAEPETRAGSEKGSAVKPHLGTGSPVESLLNSYHQLLFVQSLLELRDWPKIVKRLEENPSVLGKIATADELLAQANAVLGGAIANLRFVLSKLPEATQQANWVQKTLKFTDKTGKVLGGIGAVLQIIQAVLVLRDPSASPADKHDALGNLTAVVGEQILVYSAGTAGTVAGGAFALLVAWFFQGFKLIHEAHEAGDRDAFTRRYIKAWAATIASALVDKQVPKTPPTEGPKVEELLVRAEWAGRGDALKKLSLLNKDQAESMGAELKTKYGDAEKVAKALQNDLQAIAGQPVDPLTGATETIKPLLSSTNR
jgi:hypothetical protein